MEIGPQHVRGLPAPPRRPVLRDKIALAGPEKPDCASATSLLLYSRDGAGPPERVKAGQGLTGSARAPGAVPDGVRDSFTPSVAATKFPAGLWLCRHCTPAARLGLGTVCGDEMTWLGTGGRIAIEQAKARRLRRPASVGRDLTISVWVLGGQGETTPSQSNRHGDEGEVRTTGGGFNDLSLDEPQASRNRKHNVIEMKAAAQRQRPRRRRAVGEAWGQAAVARGNTTRFQISARPCFERGERAEPSSPTEQLEGAAARRRVSTRLVLGERPPSAPRPAVEDHLLGRRESRSPPLQGRVQQLLAEEQVRQQLYVSGATLYRRRRTRRTRAARDRFIVNPREPPPLIRRTPSPSNPRGPIASAGRRKVE